MDDAVRMRWFRSYLERCLATVLGDEIEQDADGDYSFRSGSSLCFARPLEAPVGAVRVVGLAVRVARRTPALLREVNELNQHSAAKVYLDSANIVVVELTVAPELVDEESLGDALALVSGMASELGPVLAATFAGETAFPVEPLTAAG